MTCNKCGAPCQGRYCKPCGRDRYRDTGPVGGEEDDDNGDEDE